MKRFTPVLLAAILFCSACKNTNIPTNSNISQTSSVTESSSATETTDSEPVDTEEADKEMFTSGVWKVATEGIPTGYYIIYEDGKGGATIDFETNIGSAFEYSISDNEVTFSFGSADNKTVCKILSNEKTHLKLEFPDGVIKELWHDENLSPDPDALVFYSNIELCDMALNYYTANNDYTPSGVAAVTNPDGTVTIQLYDNLGDHNSTAAWYTVDRFTAKGTDDNSGETIQLS